MPGGMGGIFAPAWNAYGAGFAASFTGDRPSGCLRNESGAGP